MLTGPVSDKDAVLTVLAPVNGAFGKLGVESLEELLADKDALTDVRILLSLNPCFQ